MELAAAIEIVRSEYVVPEGQTADPGEVAWEVRAALTPEELEEVIRALDDINTA